jgi:hypothetical protein
MSHIVVSPTGTIRLIYEDDLRGLLHVGSGQVMRASHVEPTLDGRWTADLSPVHGPLLGPFDTRKEALDAEIDYLNIHVL